MNLKTQKHNVNNSQKDYAGGASEPQRRCTSYISLSDCFYHWFFAFWGSIEMLCSGSSRRDGILAIHSCPRFYVESTILKHSVLLTELFLTVVRAKKNYYWYCIPLGRLWLGATTKRPPSQRDANKLEGKWNVRTSKKPSKQTCVPYVTQAPSPEKVAQLGSHRSTGLTNLGFSGENKGRYFLPYSSDSLPYSQSSSKIYSPILQLPCKGVLIHSPILLGRSP